MNRVSASKTNLMKFILKTTDTKVTMSTGVFKISLNILSRKLNTRLPQHRLLLILVLAKCNLLGKNWIGENFSFPLYS